MFGAPRDCLFPLPVEEKAISGLPGNARDCLFPLPVEEKAISGSPGRPKSSPFRMILDAGFDPSRLPLPPWGDEKVTREAAVASSRLPFPPQGERKGHRELSQTPLPETPEAPRKGQPGPPQSFLAMDFIPRGPFSSLSLTVRSLPCLIQAYVCISGPFERAGGAGELCSFERAGEAGELCSLPFAACGRTTNRNIFGQKHPPIYARQSKAKVGGYARSVIWIFL